VPQFISPKPGTGSSQVPGSNTNDSGSFVLYRPGGPIVINYLGFPSTSGGSLGDYAMVDKVAVPPEAATSFSERSVRLCSIV
jgi:predicted O-linked N-acetylglucosamine transferase (SPINDLY family)